MTNPEMTELLPCPFCGGEAALKIGRGNSNIQCTSCDLYLMDETKQAAVERWNARANDDNYVSCMEDSKAIVATYRKRMPDGQWMHLNYPIKKIKIECYECEGKGTKKTTFGLAECVACDGYGFLNKNEKLDISLEELGSKLANHLSDSLPKLTLSRTPADLECLECPNRRTPQPAAQEVNPREFHTGGYMAKCHDCGEAMTGVDKRQPWCKVCVDKWNAAIVAPPAQEQGATRSDTVERVARAIAKAKGYLPDVTVLGVGKPQWQYYIAEAKAAIASLTTSPANNGSKGHELSEDVKELIDACNAFFNTEVEFPGAENYKLRLDMLEQYENRVRAALKQAEAGE